MAELIISGVRNAKSLNSENTIFDVEIEHPKMGWIPYTLHPSDRDMTIKNEELILLIGSDYLPYVEPTEQEITAKEAAKIRRQRDSLLKNNVDVIAGNSLRWNALTVAEQSAWAEYRTQLLNVPQQENFGKINRLSKP
jgi:hypothetical protein